MTNINAVEKKAELMQQMEESSPRVAALQYCLTQLEARCAALAAENAGLKEVIEAVRGVADQSSGIAGWHLNGEIAKWEDILPEIDDIEAPATDAYMSKRGE